MLVSRTFTGKIKELRQGLAVGQDSGRVAQFIKERVRQSLQDKAKDERGCAQTNGCETSCKGHLNGVRALLRLVLKQPASSPPSA